MRWWSAPRPLEETEAPRWVAAAVVADRWAGPHRQAVGMWPEVPCNAGRAEGWPFGPRLEEARW